ncbi:TRI1-like protein [Tanacetum coccineum]
MASAIRVFGKRLMSTVTTTTTTADVPPKRGRPAGILKVVPVSKPLGEFLGVHKCRGVLVCVRIHSSFEDMLLQRPQVTSSSVVHILLVIAFSLGCCPHFDKAILDENVFALSLYIDTLWNGGTEIKLIQLDLTYYLLLFDISVNCDALQNPSNKKEILCDDKLKTIFNGKDQVGFLEIAKLLSQHFVKST